MPRLKAEQRKEQLVKVATQVFAKGGYAATTTAEIAEAAGVTEPILYRHFKNKQELFVAIVQEVSEATVAHFAELAAKESDPIRRIRKVCSSIADHIRKHAEAYHVLHGALTTSQDKRVLEVIKQHYAKMHGFFRQLIKQGQDGGAFDRKIDARRAAWHIVMGGVGYATLSLNLEVIDRATISETIEEVVRGMQR
jgi:AcrR family transcriptional regulator